MYYIHNIHTFSQKYFKKVILTYTNLLKNSKPNYWCQFICWLISISIESSEFVTKVNPSPLWTMSKYNQIFLWAGLRSVSYGLASGGSIINGPLFLVFYPLYFSTFVDFFYLVQFFPGLILLLFYVSSGWLKNAYDPMMIRYRKHTLYWKIFKNFCSTIS